MIAFRFDRGELVRPVAGTDLATFEGIAGRVHTPGDALHYPSGPEHRDALEVASIARQLAQGGLLVTIGHPATMPAARDRDVRIAGRIVGGRLDGDHAVARIAISDPAALALINRGLRELSLGYACELDAKRWQRGIRLDHLALVEAARCGATCSISRSDSKGPVHMCTTTDKLARFDAETSASIRMKARTACAHIVDEFTRADAEQRFIVAEVARMDATPFTMTAPKADAESEAKARMHARTSNAWRTGGES